MAVISILLYVMHMYMVIEPVAEPAPVKQRRLTNNPMLVSDFIGVHISFRLA